MKRLFTKLSILSLGLSAVIPCVFAATPIDISHKGVDYLQAYITKPGFTKGSQTTLVEHKRQMDINQTMHVRAEQTFAGFPVWGSHIVLHVKNGGGKGNGFAGAIAQASAKDTTMNGTLYQDLEKDLQNTPAYIFNPLQAKKVLDQAINLYQHEVGRRVDLEAKKNQLMVYVDAKHKAHWAYYVRFYDEQQGYPRLPTYIIDAISLQIYKHWDDVRHRGLSKIKGGGYGGNFNMGKLIYDGGENHLPALEMQRDNKTQMCYLQNKDVVLLNFKNRDFIKFRCTKTDANHNNVYWDDLFDMVNGGYSPSNDALYAGQVVRDLYQNWYQIPVLTEFEAPQQIVMIMHTSEELSNIFPEQAIWDPEHEVMFFGDGKNFFYPLTSIDVTAHEISHGFTQQHSNLSIDGDAGGLGESFSDMAGQAAQFYVRGKNDWKIGSEITKKKSIALRYMDHPNKDCYGRLIPGERCSIENMDQYNSYLKKHENDYGLDEKTMMFFDNRQPDEHFTSGIFNRVFYLLANSDHWGVRKAFDVMVQANRFYWVSDSTFTQAACGILKATDDLKYDSATVKKALTTVGIDTSDC